MSHSETMFGLSAFIKYYNPNGQLLHPSRIAKAGIIFFSPKASLPFTSLIQCFPFPSKIRFFKPLFPSHYFPNTIIFLRDRISNMQHLTIAVAEQFDLQDT